MLAIQSLISALFAATVYMLIVKNRGSLSAYLVGYGAIIPVVVVLPHYLVPLLRMTNISLVVGVSALSVIIPFHCSEGE